MGQGKRGHQVPAATLMEHSLKIPCDHRIPAAGMSSPDTEHGCLLGATPASAVWDSHGDSHVPHSLEDRRVSCGITGTCGTARPTLRTTVLEGLQSCCFPCAFFSHLKPSS